jgi:hypothetical protein
MGFQLVRGTSATPSSQRRSSRQTKRAEWLVTGGATFPTPNLTRDDVKRCLQLSGGVGPGVGDGVQHFLRPGRS